MMDALRKEIGQLFMVGFYGLQPNDAVTRLIQEQRVGGIILFRRNVHSPSQVAELCERLQAINAQVNDTPLLIAIDQEGGMVMRIEEGVTPMPSAMAYQAAGSEENCEALHRISGFEMRALGINMVLAPVLDVNNNRHNPIIGVRAFGEDAGTVIRYGMAALRGLRSAGVVTTAKHFPGHGDTTIDSHLMMPTISHNRTRLDAVELPPFKAATLQGLDAIMTAHVMFPEIEKEQGLPATFSKAVLTDLLRHELGFKGVVISDCMEMAAIANGVGVAQGAVKAVLAGTDIVLISHQESRQRAAIDALIKAVESGIISEERIHAAFARIQTLKQQKLAAKSSAFALKQAESLELSKQVHRASLQVKENFHPLNPHLPVHLITIEVQIRSEMDEAANGTHQAVRGTLLPKLLKAGVLAKELVLSPTVSNEEFHAALSFTYHAEQIVLQTYNAVLNPGQQRLIEALPQQKLWLVAGRLPYDMDLASHAQARLANFSNRPAALEPVVERLLVKM